MTIALKPLVLAGGKSTRMKAPKHLLRYPDGTPLYQHQVSILQEACPEANTIHISLAQDSPLDDLLQSSPEPSALNIIRDLDANATQESAGPAQGLLSAYKSDPTATWLVVAVDYPLMTAEAVRKLRDAYETPVTCFQNEDGFCEPLVGIWNPDALQRLLENVENGRGSSPSVVVRQLGGRQIRVQDGSRVLMNVNTEVEWTEVLRLLEG